MENKNKIENTNETENTTEAENTNGTENTSEIENTNEIEGTNKIKSTNKVESKTKTKNKILIITLSVLLIISLYFGAVMLYRYNRLNNWLAGEGEIAEPRTELEIGEMAPDFTLPLLTGETFTLSEHRGTPVVVNFWATWCGPCVRKMPSTQALSEEFADQVIFIGVNIGEDLRVIQSFIDEGGYTFPIGLDEDGETSFDWNPRGGIPYTVIVDSDGIITEIFSSWADAMHTLFKSAIENTLQ